jgi:glycerol-3-phosphate dehydrogenase
VSWTLEQRTSALTRLAEEGAELVVIGGGITGAGVLRDAALRGLSCVLFERDDFASGTSSHTSKMIHGGLRYIAEGQLGVTRESCVERDRLAALNPNLVRPLPFLFCAFDDGVPPWKMVAGLSIYGALSGFKGGSFKILKRREIEALSRDVRLEGLRAAGLYYDQQVDDARIVLETIKDARRAGAEAVHHAECTGFDHDAEGRVSAVRIRDRLSGREHRIRAERVVNATGPSVDRLRKLDTQLAHEELRPAKGIHAVIGRERVHADAAVSFQAADGRHMFLCPWQDVHLIGTTDAFTDEIDEPRVTRAEVAYVLSAANHAFPRANLSENDLVSVYAGVRPLVSDPAATTPPSRVSREHRFSEDRSGMISIAGGKLTTYRAMAEETVDRVVRTLPAERRARLLPCATDRRPLRDDAFDRDSFGRELSLRFGIDEVTRERLIGSWGKEALRMLEGTEPALHRRISGSHYLLAEVPWSIREECAASLCDVLERRVRLSVFAKGQGLDELSALAQAAQTEAGVSDAELRDQMERYRERVATRYTVQA